MKLGSLAREPPQLWINWGGGGDKLLLTKDRQRTKHHPGNILKVNTHGFKVVEFENKK